MKIPIDKSLSSIFLDNFFCLIPNTNLAFVAISKNAVTFLKKVAFYNETDKWIDEIHEIHNLIGFSNASPFLINVSKMEEYEKVHGKRIKFAVWRDPVARIESTYKLFCLEREYREYFLFLGLHHDSSFESFWNFLQYEWTKKNPIYQDEHIRRQVDYYKKEDVDFILPIDKVQQFLTDHKVPFLSEKSNETTVRFKLEDPEKITHIKSYYKDDYKIVCNYI